MSSSSGSRARCSIKASSKASSKTSSTAVARAPGIVSKTVVKQLVMPVVKQWLVRTDIYIYMYIFIYTSSRVTDALLVLLRQPAVDAIIDGANVGYYSKRPDQGHTLSYSQVAVVE